MSRRGANIYKRKDGRWEARYVKGRDEEGNICYGYLYAASYEEARRRQAEKIAGDGKGRLQADCLLFEEAAKDWLAVKKLKVKESTYAKYLVNVHRHILPLIGNAPLYQLTTRRLLDMSHQLLEVPLAPKTVRDLLVMVKGILREAARTSEGLFLPPEIVYPPDVRRDLRILTHSEQQRLESILCTEINMDKLGILLCLYTGLRVGEICALRWGDICLEESWIRVDRTIQRIQAVQDDDWGRTKVVIQSPKSRTSMRTIPLPSFLTELLRPFSKESPHTYILTSSTDRYLEPRTYQNHWKRYLRLADIPDVPFHALRHTFATRCVEIGFDVKSLSEILGHANVNITLNRYVHASLSLKRQNMNRFSPPVSFTPSK